MGYTRDNIKIVTPTLHQWKISRYEQIWYLPLFLNDYVLRPKTKLKIPGKVTKIWMNSELLNGKLPLIFVEIDWLIETENSQNVFVWLGIGNILLNKQFKFGPTMMIFNELYLASIECNDRVSRGMDWNDSTFESQDGGQLLGKVTTLQLTDKGGYEAMVVWDNGKEFNYRFGLSSFFDIDIVQRRSHKNIIPPMFCGDVVIRSNDWRWDNQDSVIGIDDDSDFVSPQIGVVQEIYNNSHNDEINPNADDTDHKILKIKDYISAIPSAEIKNECLIEVKWIDNKYDAEMMEEEIIKTQANGLYDFEERVVEKYRYGYEDAFDVAIVGQHTPIPLIPYDKFMSNGNEIYSEYKAVHRLKLEQMSKQKDVLYFTHYRKMQKNEQQKEDEKEDENEKKEESLTEYEEELLKPLDGVNNKWPKVVVEKLNNCDNLSFICRFIDVTKFD